MLDVGDNLEDRQEYLGPMIEDYISEESWKKLEEIDYFILPSLEKINRMLNITPFVLWMLYGGIYIVFSLDKGLWAMRDGSQNIDTLYLLVGFTLFSSKENFEFFIKTIRISFFLALFYVLLIPFRIIDYIGYPSGLEGQELKWCATDQLREVDILPADRSLIEKLAAELQST